jgi:ribosomal protein L37AE/L43A
MKKYRVLGVIEVVVAKEVWAHSEEEAYNKAANQLSTLESYLGNGGCDKLIGVDGADESVDTFGNTIEYNDIEVLEDNPNYFECPKCGEECWSREDVDGDEYWWCDDCEQAFDDEGEEAYPDFEEAEEEDE